MRTWIELMSRMAGGLLFQGGYVTTPTVVGGGRPAAATSDQWARTVPDAPPSPPEGSVPGSLSCA